MYWILLLVNFLDIVWWLDDPPSFFLMALFVCAGNIPSFAAANFREDPDEADEDDDDEDDDDDKEEGQSWARNRGDLGFMMMGNQFWTTWLILATQICV